MLFYPKRETLIPVLEINDDVQVFRWVCPKGRIYTNLVLFGFFNRCKTATYESMAFSLEFNTRAGSGIYRNQIVVNLQYSHPDEAGYNFKEEGFSNAIIREGECFTVANFKECIGTFILQGARIQ